jgi:hypothetical protein
LGNKEKKTCKAQKKINMEKKEIQNKKLKHIAWKKLFSYFLKYYLIWS